MTMAARKLRVETGKDPRTLAERGRMMLAPDVVELLPKVDGKPIRTELWVRRSFASDKKRFLGKTPYWWEADVRAALDEGIR